MNKQNDLYYVFLIIYMILLNESDKINKLLINKTSPLTAQQAELMGNSESKSTSTISDWQKFDTENGIEIWKNKKNNELAQMRQITLDPQYDLNDELKIYHMREHNRESLVRAFATEPIDKKKGGADGICTSTKKAKVLTEKMPYRLSELPQLTFPESLLVLRECLRGYNRVYKNYGPIHITPQLIGLNHFGEVKCWVNENWALNHPTHELPTLQTTKLKDVSKDEYLAYGAKYRDETEMVHNIVAVVQDKCEEGVFPKALAGQVEVHSTTFKKLELYLEDFVNFNEMFVPPKINYETIFVDKYHTRLQQQQSGGQAHQQSSQQQYKQYQHQSGGTVGEYTTVTKKKTTRYQGDGEVRVVNSPEVVTYSQFNPIGGGTVNSKTSESYQVHSQSTYGANNIDNSKRTLNSLGGANGSYGSGGNYNATFNNSTTNKVSFGTGGGAYIAPSGTNYSGTNYGYGTSAGGATYSYTQSKPVMGANNSYLNGTGNTSSGFPLAQPKTIDDFKDHNSNSKLIDGLTGELIGAVSYGSGGLGKTTGGTNVSFNNYGNSSSLSGVGGIPSSYSPAVNYGTGGSSQIGYQKNTFSQYSGLNIQPSSTTGANTNSLGYSPSYGTGTAGAGGSTTANNNVGYSFSSSSNTTGRYTGGGYNNTLSKYESNSYGNNNYTPSGSISGNQAVTGKYADEFNKLLEPTMHQQSNQLTNRNLSYSVVTADQNK